MNALSRCNDGRKTFLTLKCCHDYFSVANLPSLYPRSRKADATCNNNARTKSMTKLPAPKAKVIATFIAASVQINYMFYNIHNHIIMVIIPFYNCLVLINIICDLFFAMNKI